jgi:hypothetical protein
MSAEFQTDVPKSSENPEAQNTTENQPFIGLRGAKLANLKSPPRLRHSIPLKSSRFSRRSFLDNTLYWLLLLIYEGPWTTHFTGYCCGLCEGSGNTLYWAPLGLMWATFINGFKIIYKNKIIVEMSKCRFPYTEVNIPSQKKSHVTAPGS